MNKAVLLTKDETKYRFTFRNSKRLKRPKIKTFEGTYEQFEDKHPGMLIIDKVEIEDEVPE